MEKAKLSNLLTLKEPQEQIIIPDIIERKVISIKFTINLFDNVFITVAMLPSYIPAN